MRSKKNQLPLHFRYKGKTGRAPSTNLVQAGTLQAERLKDRSGSVSKVSKVEKVSNLMAISNIHLQVRPCQMCISDFQVARQFIHQTVSILLDIFNTCWDI